MGMGSHRESRAVEDCSLGFNTIVHAKTGTFLVNRNLTTSHITRSYAN